MQATLKRSTIKSLTHRAVTLIITFTLVYIITDSNMALSLGFIVVDTIIMTLIYFIHERAWARVGWGYADDQGGSG